MAPKAKPREKAKEKKKEKQKAKPTQKEIAAHGLAMVHAREEITAHTTIHGDHKAGKPQEHQQVKERVRMAKERENQNPKAPVKENTAANEMTHDPHHTNQNLHTPEEDHHLDNPTNLLVETGSKAHVQKVPPVITGMCKFANITMQVLAVKRRENANSFTVRKLKCS